MRRLYFWMLSSMVVLLTGCATNGVQEPPIQRISAEELERIMPKPVPNLSLDEIIKLSKDGLSPEEIIDRIKVSNSQYDLSPSQALELSKAGVNPKVLDYIHQSREQALRDNFADEINKREKQKRAEEDKLKRELRMRSMHYYDPWWGYTPSPYWRFRSPFYGPGFGYHWGW